MQYTPITEMTTFTDAATDFDAGQNPAKRSEDYQRGYDLGQDAIKILIGRGDSNAWGAVMPDGQTTAYESIGYHANTQFLLCGMIASGALVVGRNANDRRVWYDGQELLRYTVNRQFEIEGAMQDKKKFIERTKSLIANLQDEYERLLDERATVNRLLDWLEATRDSSAWNQAREKLATRLMNDSLQITESLSLTSGHLDDLQADLKELQWGNTDTPDSIEIEDVFGAISKPTYVVVCEGVGTGVGYESARDAQEAAARMHNAHRHLTRNLDIDPAILPDVDIEAR